MMTSDVAFNGLIPATWPEVPVERCPAFTQWDDIINVASVRYTSHGLEVTPGDKPHCPGEHLWHWVSNLRVAWIRHHSPVPIVDGVRRAPHPYVRYCDRPPTR